MPEHTPLSWATRITATVTSRHLENALAMLDSLPDHHHLESWTKLVKCFGEQGFLETAKTIFETRMPVHDRVSSTVMLMAYARHGHFVQAKEMLQSLPDRDMESWNSLLHVNVADEALKVFQRMPARDVVSWTSMLTSYVQAGRAEEALHLYRCMNLEGERINRVTLVAAIDACADAAAIADGQAIHFGYAAHDHYCWPDTKLDARVENSLLSMYGRCGSLAQATALFVEMRERRDLVSWNTMITAYAQRQSRSNTSAALEVFQRMSQQGVRPNDITFTALLCACSRSGWLDAAWSLFRTMIADFGLEASTRHIVCMVDLLGRAGRLDDAERAIRGASLAELGVAWRTLLAASEVHGNANTGARAAKLAASSACSSRSPAYVLLSNLLTTS
ncbi:pentatricopeptide repeat-containing protein At4g02750 [Selaginella moellendorffii]|nr:pentatricopeptide repeat-containing protein At4g02750 [Selaginella moellendorffii]|eukprot:XP_002986048.2 pentatricopeptide repeat-containing protein At4g02750 [Selaginella moellendorffii]